MLHPNLAWLPNGSDLICGLCTCVCVYMYVCVCVCLYMHIRQPFACNPLPGGWALIGMEGSTWSINSTDFRDEQFRGSPAFFQLYVDVDDKNTSQYILQVGGVNTAVSFPDRIPSLTEATIIVHHSYIYTSLIPRPTTFSVARRKVTGPGI